MTTSSSVRPHHDGRSTRFGIEYRQQLALKVSTPDALVDGVRDATGGLRHSGDVTWPTPQGWKPGNHWIPEIRQNLYAASLSIIAPSSASDPLVDVIDLDVISCP